MTVKKEYLKQTIKGNGSKNIPDPSPMNGWKFLSEKAVPRRGEVIRVFTRTKQIASKKDVDELANLFSGLSGVGGPVTTAAPVAAAPVAAVAVVEEVQADAMDRRLSESSGEEIDALLGMLAQVRLSGGRRRWSRKSRKNRKAPKSRKNRKATRRN